MHCHHWQADKVTWLSQGQVEIQRPTDLSPERATQKCERVKPKQFIASLGTIVGSTISIGRAEARVG